MTRRTAALFFVWVVLAKADTVVLRNGTRVKGVWMGADSDKISLLVDGQVKPFARADVSAVTLGDEPATASAPAGGSNTADDGAMSVPETANMIYARDQAGKLVPLEKDRAKLKGVMGGLGEMEWKIDGAKSAVRRKYGQKMIFVVRLEKANDKEFKTFQLVELESNTKKDHRQSPLATARSRPVLIPFEVTKIGEAVYSLKPQRNLPPGEYAFQHRNDFHCFGVDDAEGGTTP